MLAGVGRLDRDPIALLHLTHEMRKLVVVAILPDAVGKKARGLIPFVPRSADEPVVDAFRNDCALRRLIFYLIAFQHGARTTSRICSKSLKNC